MYCKKNNIINFFLLKLVQFTSMVTILFASFYLSYIFWEVGNNKINEEAFVENIYIIGTLFIIGSILLIMADKQLDTIL